ncbi:MAG TPA: GNAT family N-acetyltransferase [Xanthomonadales bacterium]|nr:GNAT family N-acetyltransferase [Xanthomonadales bacterium]
MQGTKRFDSYLLKPLSKDLAIKYVKQLNSLLNQIPFVTYTTEDVLAESKVGREFYGKWEHSLIVFDGNKPVAVIIAYERKSEENEQYPANTIYINELAVDEHYQRKGIAKNLLKSFFEYNDRLGFIFLDGSLNYTVQTSFSDKNQYVIDLYKSFGFAQRATKQYEDRTDVVMGLKRY